MLAYNIVFKRIIIAPANGVEVFFGLIERIPKI